ncbi:hypothetical protein NUW54_g13032 [Trametes sanguinea]|uniref:Uncharacterized protein n=1 Tax=Trametes sanguinea TaxID=158606 RepID=A0ACC1MR99_9APHY|nr:hypothetical protein NUW54_g13032 [Trametes sanguinea]
MSNLVASAVRARMAATARGAVKPRTFASSMRRQDGGNAPKPPKPIDDSTSALEYKRTLRHRPPPLPAMDLPRSRSAEEAVTNILYNTPPPSLQPFKKCVVPAPSYLAWTKLFMAADVQACAQLSSAERARCLIQGVWDLGRTGLQHRLLSRMPHRDPRPESHVYRSAWPGRCCRASPETA